MKNNFKLRNHFFILALSILFSSCLTNVDELEIEDPCEEITFSINVKPIIDNNCTQCHSTNGGQFPNLDSYTGVSNNSATVLSEVVSKRMPQGGSLTNDEIAAIKCWVENGALNN